MKPLSSRLTPFNKFIVPGLFLVCSPVWAMVATGPIPLPFLALLWFSACAFLLWWTLPIKRVHLTETHFRISNYRRTVDVPLAHLQRISEERRSHTPNLTLYFTPTTPFGPKIRIIPPVEFFSLTTFEEIAATLQAIIRHHHGPSDPPPTPPLTARTLALLDHHVPENSAYLPTLNESELNALIDHLPHDSPLRDLARQQRQTRWYG